MEQGGERPDFAYHDHGAPYASEKEPEPKGFRVRVKQPDLIFQAAQQGVSGELGKVLAAYPLVSVSVDLISGRGHFNLVASIDIDYQVFSEAARKTPPVSMHELRKKILEEITSDHPERQERGGKYFIKATNGTKFVLEGITAQTLIQISTGMEEVLPAPATTPENMKSALQDLADTLTGSVNGIYRLTERPVLDEELVLRAPPREQIDVRPSISGESGISGSITPEELRRKLEIERPNLSFEDIGGQKQAKQEIEGLAFALKNPELYLKWGTKPPKGVILYGPPGTGKTLLAKVLAAQAEARFLHVQASDIASKWYGESERIVRDVFELAREIVERGENTIIFFDEIDAIVPNREGAHEATQRIISEILQHMDGIASNANYRVMVVASTNRLDSIDPAILRAGRFDRWVEVGLPDENDRKQIFEVHMRKARERANRDVFGDVNLESVIEMTDGASGSDIAEIIRRALEKKVRQEGTTGVEPGPVTTEDLLRETNDYEKIKQAKRAIGFRPPHNSD